MEIYEKRKEKAKSSMRKHYRENKESRSEYQSNWLKNNKEKTKEYSKKYSNKKHKITKQEWISCKTYFNNQCAYCGLSIDKHFKKYKGTIMNMDLHKEHVDHRGEGNLSNCVPACQVCNSSKHDWKLEDWYNEDNPNFTEERLNKILKWVNEDYKMFTT